MRKIIVLIIALLTLSQTLFAWGRTEHDAIVYIAECNLTKKARTTIEGYLGQSIVYYAAWMDDYRTTDEYGFTTNWHVGYVDKDLQNTPAIQPAKGDCVREITNAIERLRNYKNLDDSTVAINLKYVIHMAADMHCPAHIKYVNTPNFKVKLNGTTMTYHSAWDYGILRAAHFWNYTEYQHQLDRLSKAQQREITKGTPAQWFHESALYCRDMYSYAQPNEELKVAFVNKTHKMAETQMIKAAYRLAAILNELFG